MTTVQGALDLTTWSGRDRVLFATLYNTGAGTVVLFAERVHHQSQTS